ncbi:MAG: NYN domain-containing protein [Phycisphaerae bacterium]|nr:NYN domain-containing protein [Phycisphaerae bacterium]
MKKVAVLLDGGVVLRRLYQMLERRHAEAADVFRFGMSCALPQEEEVFRLYYYDCPPYEESGQNPLDPDSKIDFSRKAITRRRRSLQQKLSLMSHVAFRRGGLFPQGWRLRETALRHIAAEPRHLDAADLEPDFEQKRVDIKIGLDVAWPASKQIVDRVVLVTGDTGFVPALTFARREGTQVVLVPIGRQGQGRSLRARGFRARRSISSSRDSGCLA